MNRLFSILLASAGILAIGTPRDAAAQLSLHPDGSTQTTAPNSSGFVTFGVSGGQSGHTYFRDPVNCTGPISCSTSAPQSWTGPAVPQLRFDYTTQSTTGTGRISLRVYEAGGTPSDTGYFIIQVGTNGVSVTPDLATATARPAGTGGYAETFTIANSGTLQNTYSFSCTSSWLTCGTVPGPLTLAGQTQTTVSMPYSVGTTVTTGTLTLTASGTSASDQGQYQVPIIGYNVSVTPDGTGTPSRDQGTTYSETYTITNTGADNTFNLTCSQIGTLTCVSVNPPTLALTGGGPPGTATVTYTTGGAGGSRLTLTATGTGAGGGASDDGYYMVSVASYGVAVTPDGATEPMRAANTGGYGASFTVNNSGSVAENFSFSCTGSNGVTCTSTPAAQSIAAGTSVSLPVTYNVGAVGTGTLQLTATSPHATDPGTYSVPIGTFSVSVSPDGSTAPSRNQNTGGYAESFTISNGGTAANTYSFTCTGSNGVACGTVPAPLTINPGAPQSVSMPYSVSSPNTGRLALKATGSGGASDSGWYNVPIACTTCFSIVPDGSTLVQSTDTNASVSFGMIGFTNGQSYSRELVCSGPVINCASTVPDFFTYTSGMSIPVTYTTASTPGAARVRLRVYQGGGGSDSGWVNITVTSYGVAVTPDGDSTAQRLANTGGYVDTFTVQNTGSASNTFSFSCSPVGTIACGSAPSPVTIGAGAQVKVGMPYSVGGNTSPNRLVLTATGTKASDQGFYNVRVLSYQVVVTPKGTSTAPRAQNTSGYSQRFTIYNGGSTSNTFSFICAASAGVTCATPMPGPLTLAPLTQDSVAIPYSVGAIGNGTLIVRTTGTNTSDTGYVTVPIVRYGVAVTPDGGTTQNRGQGTGGYSESFTVTNTGTIATDYSFTCIGASGVTCGAAPGTLNIKPDSSKTVSMPYSVGTPQMGTLTLRATGPGVSDTGFYNVVIVCTINCFTIVPDGTNLTRPTDTTATVNFGGVGLTAGQSYFREVLCTSPITNCSSSLTDPFTYTGGMSLPVTYSTTSATGTGRVRLRVYQGGGGSDSGWVNVTVLSYGVAVTPDGASTPQRLANTGTFTDSFTVTNTGTASNTFSFSCRIASNVTCVQLPAPLTLAGLASQKVAVGYNVGDFIPQTRLQLAVTGTKASDDGYYLVPILQYRVVVQPTNGNTTPARPANTSGYTQWFSIFNGGSTSNDFSFTCTGSGGVTCGALPPVKTLASYTQDSVPMPYSVGAAGTGRLVLRATGTNTTAADSVTVPIVAYGVAVTPDGGIAPARVANSSGFSESFTVRNTGQTSNTYALSCGVAVAPVTCTGVNPASMTLVAGDSAAASASYNVGAAGNGTLRLKAVGSNAVDSGSYAVHVIGYGVAVTPDGATAPVRASNTSGHSELFTVQNTGTDSTVFALTCSQVAPVTCVSVVPTSIKIAAGLNASATVNFTVGAVGSGTLRLIASGPGGTVDTGSYVVPVQCATCFAPSTLAGGVFNKDSRYVLIETANSYTPNGQITQLTDARGKITTYLFGGNSNNAFLTKVARAHDASGPVDLTTDIAYDANGYVQSIRDEGGSFRYFTYDGYGRLRQVKNNAGTAERAYGYTYSRIAPNWTFDPANPNAVIDTAFIQQTPSAKSVVTRAYVDGLGRDIQTVVSDGATSHVTATQYDSAGRAWRVWKPYSRSGAGFDQNFVANATAFYNTYHGSSSAKPYAETAYTPDALSRVKRLTAEYIGTTPSASVVMTYGLDVATKQRYTETTDEVGKKSRRYTDLLGNAVRSLLGYGSADQTTTTFLYNILGQRTLATDPRGLNTSYTIDTRGLLASQTSPDAGTTSSKYDKGGNLRYVQDANRGAAGQVAFTTYDFAARALTSGVGAGTFTALDPDGTPTALETTTANWSVVRQYDAKPTNVFPWSLFWTQISPLALQNVSGRLAAVASKSNASWQATLFSYDADGRVATRYIFTHKNGATTVLTAVNTTVAYGRDLRGALTTRAVTVGSNTFNHWYDYDTRGLLWKVFASTSATKPATADVTDTYRSSGMPQNYQFQSGPLMPLRYTIREQLEQIGDPALTTYPFSARYAYHPNSTISETEYYSGGSPAAQKRYRYVFGTASYDALNRLKSADFSSWSGTAWTTTAAYDLAGISYDAAGNLTGLQRYRDAGTLIDNLTYSNAATSNRLNSVADAVTTTAETWDAESGAFSYDANGNMKTAPAPYSVTAVSYDERNLPLSITRAGVTSTYRYDDVGERISKQVGAGNAEVYIREGATTLAVATIKSNGTLASWYFNVLAGDRVVGRQPNSGSRSYYHFDALGSTRAVTQGATVVESYDFEPWGLLMAARARTGTTKEGFSGKEQDSETGLDYFGARYYMPALGRWAAVDPMVDNSAEWSPYNYVMNNPVMHTDPDGRQVVKDANAHWDNVAIAGHLQGGFAGNAKAAGATAMSTLLEGFGVNQADRGVDKMADGHVAGGLLDVGLAVVGNLPLGIFVKGGNAAVRVTEEVTTHVDNVARVVLETGEHTAGTLAGDAERGVTSTRRSRGPSAATKREADAAATDPQGKLRCQYCQEEVTREPGHPNSLERDHMDPHAKGGGNGPGNIIDSCRTCNRNKGANGIIQWLLKTMEKNQQP